MVFLGFGKYARADKIFAVEPLRTTSAAPAPHTRLDGGHPRAAHRLAHRARILAEMGGASRTRARPAPQDAPPPPPPQNLHRGLTGGHRLGPAFGVDTRRSASATSGAVARPGSPRSAPDRSRRRPLPGLHAHPLDPMVGLLGLASLIPLLVVPLIGGAVADAVDRRRLLLTETGWRSSRRSSSATRCSRPAHAVAVRPEALAAATSAPATRPERADAALVPEDKLAAASRFRASTTRSRRSADPRSPGS